VRCGDVWRFGEDLEFVMCVVRWRSEFVGRATRGDDKPRGRGSGRTTTYYTLYLDNYKK